MTQKRRSGTERTLRFLRLQTREAILKTLLGAFAGIVGYIVLYPVELPSYKLMGLLTVQIDLAILVIPIVAAFCGPLAGLLAGVFGTLGADALFMQQIIALGFVDFSYGLLGFITGIPRYTEEEGLSNGRTLGKLILFTMAGFSAMLLVYVFGLIVIAGQNVLPTILYNFLPFFSASLVTLLIATPFAARLVDILANYARRQSL